jgi:hypothetical protein
MWSVPDANDVPLEETPWFHLGSGAETISVPRRQAVWEREP